jgi:alkylhydroperoxidase family enzyme
LNGLPRLLPAVAEEANFTWQRALVRGTIKEAGVSVPDQLLLAYAEKLTGEPATITDDDIGALRAHRFDDAQPSEAMFTGTTFNLCTRMADPLGIAAP